MSGSSYKPKELFWLLCPAIAEMMDEDKLSNEEAYAKLLEMLGETSHSPEIAKHLARLRTARDEGEFRMMLGEECLRAMGREHWLR